MVIDFGKTQEGMKKTPFVIYFIGKHRHTERIFLH